MRDASMPIVWRRRETPSSTAVHSGWCTASSAPGFMDQARRRSSISSAIFYAAISGRSRPHSTLKCHRSLPSIGALQESERRGSFQLPGVEDKNPRAYPCRPGVTSCHLFLRQPTADAVCGVQNIFHAVGVGEAHIALTIGTEADPGDDCNAHFVQ